MVGKMVCHFGLTPGVGSLRMSRPRPSTGGPLYPAQVRKVDKRRKKMNSKPVDVSAVAQRSNAPRPARLSIDGFRAFPNGDPNHAVGRTPVEEGRRSRKAHPAFSSTH